MDEALSLATFQAAYAREVFNSTLLIKYLSSNIFIYKSQAIFKHP